MKNDTDGMRIPLMVGTELRISNEGEVTVGNPEIELAIGSEAGSAAASDAVLLYRFDSERREHVLRLLDPVADREHQKHHRRDD